MWKLYESRMSFGESSMKAGWLSLKALRKEDQDDFRWVLYESRMTCAECSTKAGWLLLNALRKQGDLCWVSYESRMTCAECSMKAGWLSFRALQKPFKKHVNRDNTEFRDKIAYVGGPSCRRRPWPVVERRSRAPPTSATLTMYEINMKDGLLHFTGTRYCIEDRVQAMRGHACIAQYFQMFVQIFS